MITKRYFISQDAPDKELRVYVLINDQHFWKARFSVNNQATVNLKEYVCGSVSELPVCSDEQFVEVNEQVFNKKTGTRARFIHWAVSAYYVCLRSMCALTGEEGLPATV